MSDSSKRGSMKRGVVPLLVVAALTVAACGSSSSSSSSTAAATTSGSSSTSSAGATPSGADPAARALLPSTVLSSGVLRDGINSPNLPMEYPGSGGQGFQGYDIDLAKAIAAKLGLNLSLSNVAFVQLLPSLSTGRIDIMLSALSDKPSRRGVANWVDYFKSGAKMFTTTANASKYPTLASLCGQTIETAVGTSYVQDIPKLSASLCHGKPAMKVLAVGGSLAEEEIAVKTGRAAAAVSAPENFSSLPSGYPPVGGIWSPSFYGIAVKAGNSAMLAAVKAAFTDVLHDGTYAKIAKHWGQTSSSVSTVTVNAGA